MKDEEFADKLEQIKNNQVVACDIELTPEQLEDVLGFIKHLKSGGNPNERK